MPSASGYEFGISELIGSIKKKLARQYLKNKNITVGKAFKILKAD
jgi:hypothetical protein